MEEEETEVRVPMTMTAAEETPGNLDYNEPPQEEELEDVDQGVEPHLPQATPTADEQFVPSSAAAMGHEHVVPQGVAAMRGPPGVITQSGIMK